MKASIIRLKKNRYNPRLGDIVGLVEWSDKANIHVRKSYTELVQFDVGKLKNNGNIIKNDGYIILRNIVIEPVESFKKEEFDKFIECFNA
jgi:hypothetical protein